MDNTLSTLSEINLNFDDSTLEDDYDEPIWKSKSINKPVSYSRKGTKKFLDKNLADRNRELYLQLFNEDPDSTICNKKNFEKELFSGIKEANNAPIADKKDVKTKNKRAPTKEAQKKSENPKFLSNHYKQNLEKKKAKLQEIFEKTDVYQNLQALKDMPLNIEEVDYKGNVVKRYEYYFDYEENKHDIVEIKGDCNNQKEEEANALINCSMSTIGQTNDNTRDFRSTRNEDNTLNESSINFSDTDDDISVTFSEIEEEEDNQKQKTSKSKSQLNKKRIKRKRNQSENDKQQKNERQKKKRKTESKIDDTIENSSLNLNKKGSLRNLKRKSLAIIDEEMEAENKVNANQRPKRKRKTDK